MFSYPHNFHCDANKTTKKKYFYCCGRLKTPKLCFENYGRAGEKGDVAAAGKRRAHRSQNLIS